VKRWMIACTIAALSAGIYLLVAVNHAEPRSTSRAGTPRVAPAPLAPLVMSRHDSPSLAVATERGKPGPTEAKVSEDQPASGSPPTDDEMRAQIEASFAGDAQVTPSQDRTPGIEKRVRAVIPAGSAVRSVACRSSLCRIETVHPSVEEYRDFVQRGYLTLDFATRVSNGPVFVALLAPPGQGQPVVGVAFLGLDGTTLASLTPSAPSGSP
jgi:hypothetical protein